MALYWHWQNKMGKMTIKQRVIENGEQTDKVAKFNVSIYDGNALAIFIYHFKQDGKKMYNLYTFIADKQHAKNMMKDGCKLIPDDVVSIELNLRYPHALELMRLLVKDGYKVKVYYEEPKKK